MGEASTGGVRGAPLHDVSGSADYLGGGAIAYSNDVKVMAGVPAEVIDGSGAVSAETGQAMAEAARTTYGADCGIGVTGVAGPGDRDGIAAGTVFIGVAVPGWAGVEPYAFPSRRPLVRGRAVTAALLQLTRALQRPSRGRGSASEPPVRRRSTGG